MAAGDERRALGQGRVREANVEDAAVVHALACELADAVGDSHPQPRDVKARLGELLEEPRARVLVAEDPEEGTVAGVASVWIKPDLAHGDAVVEVPMLAVGERYRRRGVGKLLMEGVQGIAADAGAGLIELVATRDNRAARDFYRSLGFVETDHIALEFVGNLEDPPDPDES